MAFKLSNGETFENKHDYSDRKYLRVLIAREKSDGTTLLESSESAEGMTDKRVQDTVTLASKDFNDIYTATDTYLLAENENYKEYPTLDEYIEFGMASNCSYFHKIEIHIVTGVWQRKLYMQWRGNVGLSNMLSSLEDSLQEAIIDGEFETQGVTMNEDEETVNITLWTNDGDINTTEIDYDELHQSITGVRVIEYKEEILD